MSERPHKDLARTYRAGAQEEPPAWVDRTILAMAHEQRSNAPQNDRSFVQRWGAAFAFTATVVLTVSVVMLVRDEQGAPVQDAQRLPEAPQTRPVPPVPSGDHEDVGRSRTAPAPAESTRGGRPPLEVQVPSASPPVAKSDQRERADMSQAPAAVPAPLRERPQGRESAAPSDSRPRTGLPEESGAAQAVARAERERDTSSVTPQAKALSSDGSLGDQPARRAAQALGAAKESSPAPAAPSVTRTPAARAPESAAGGSDNRATEFESPQQWLQRIQQLRAEGRMAEAKENLDAFRKRHPDYPLPEILK